MHYTKPSYYDTFRCTAGDCPDTCCQGWQIIIDPESIEKYKANPELWNYVKDSIDWKASEEGPTYLLKDRKCTHLTPDGLCEMQVKYGFDALCQVCQKFPRHVEEFDGERELSIDLSCPEGARMVLEDTDGSFISYDDDLEENEDYEDFDYFLYTELYDARETLFSMISDSNASYPSATIAELMESMISLGEIWQNCLDENNVYEINEAHELPKKSSPFTWQNEKRLFSKLYDLELLRPEWIETVDRTYKTIFASEENYRKACLELEKYDSFVRRILRYMIYVYFDGAVYDDKIYAKLAFSVYCVRWTFFVFFSDQGNGRDLLSAQEKEPDMEALIRAVYIFSREVEHSDLNISILEDWL
ncbi:MAG: flagellin lysine-N-methylase [Lachnospiraceae bacterium]|nr:flagellin lysine-N-methylase [Lachnospiraceae bacterium]